MAEAAPSPGAIYRPAQYLLIEQDHKDIAALVGAGIPRTQAVILLTLHRYGNGIQITSRWIERVSDLRQPEVSIAMNSFKSAGLITTTEEKSQSKGRPVKVYHVQGDIAKYVRDKIGERLAELNKGVMAVNRIFTAKGATA